MSASERHEQRRERLLQAGLELFGTQGYAGTSIRAVSAAASLNSRYFYESFSSREDLLYSVYKRIIREIVSAAIAATVHVETIEGQAHAGLKAVWTILTEDRRKARVIALEVVGVSERLERLRRDNRHAFADLLVQNSRSIVHDSVQPRLDPVLTARSLMGASMEVLVDWINGDVDASLEEIVDHLTKLFTVVTYAAIGQNTGAPPDGSG